MAFKRNTKTCLITALITAPLCIAAAALWSIFEQFDETNMFPYSGVWGNGKFDIAFDKHHKPGHTTIMIKRGVEYTFLVRYRMQDGSANFWGRRIDGGGDKPRKPFPIVISDFSVTPQQNGTVVRVEGLKIELSDTGTDQEFSTLSGIVHLPRREGSRLSE